MFVVHIQQPSKPQIKQHCSRKGFRIVEGDYPVTITKADAIKKIKNSFRKGKGYTLKPHEIEGEGLKDLYKDAKKTIKTELRQTAKSAKNLNRLEEKLRKKRLKQEMYL